MSTISFFGTLVDTIKQHYELAEISAVTIMPSLRSHAKTNEDGPDSVYRITTISESYVLRPFRNENTAAVELHNQFLRWAKENNFSMTQRIIQTRSGQDSFASDEHQWWLASYIEADPVFEWTKPTWTTENCRQSGLALSSIHQALRRFATENPSTLAFTTAGGLVIQSLKKWLASSLSVSSGFAEQLRAVAPLVSKAIAQIENSAIANEQLVHGDFHPGNLLFRAGIAVAVIDFEYLNIESPIYDLAYALVMFCTRWSGDGNADCNVDGSSGSVDGNSNCNLDGSLDSLKLQSFLSGYLSEHSEFELELLVPYMNVAAAICLQWFLERELEDRTVLHFINVLKRLENLSTMDISIAIGRA